MKRKIIILTLLLSLVCGALFVGTSCNKEAEDPNKVVLTDFSTYNPDFSVIRVLNYFGSINICKDQKYVKTGSASAKVQPLGGYISQTTPYFYYPFESKIKNINYRNISKLRNITVDIYNAENHNVSMSMGLAMGYLGTDMINKSNPIKVSLVPGWNNIVYEVDVNIINILYDINDCEGVFFGFDRVGSRSIEDAPVLYFDNITLNMFDEEQVPEDLLVLQPNEICNFDSLYQKYVVYAESEDPSCEGTVEVVKASKYGIKATSGDYVLMLTTQPSNHYGYWPKFVFPEALMKLTDMVSVPEDDYDCTYLCFDVYAYKNDGMTFYPEIFDQSYGICYNKWAVPSFKNKWSTFKIKLSELTKSMVKTPGFFRFSWSEYYGSEKQIFFFDSFRIEKIS